MMEPVTTGNWPHHGKDSRVEVTRKSSHKQLTCLIDLT